MLQLHAYYNLVHAASRAKHWTSRTYIRRREIRGRSETTKTWEEGRRFLVRGYEENGWGTSQWGRCPFYVSHKLAFSTSSSRSSSSSSSLYSMNRRCFTSSSSSSFLLSPARLCALLKTLLAPAYPIILDPMLLAPGIVPGVYASS